MSSLIYKGLLGAVVAVAGMAASAGTIVNSAHDFSTGTYAAATGGQICIACHAPHNTAVLADAPLWNHALNATQAYTLYSSATMNATGAVLGATSKLCLSCHDGTLAVNSFGGATGTTFITGASNLGTALTNDHPIGITYDTALATADGSLKDPSLAANTVTIGAGTKTKTGTIAATMLYAGKLECASCHDVHNTYAATTANLVKVTMAASGLCTACHTK